MPKTHAHWQGFRRTICGRFLDLLPTTTRVVELRAAPDQGVIEAGVTCETCVRLAWRILREGRIPHNETSRA